MRRLQTVVQHPSEAPSESYADPTILLEGNPLLEKWAHVAAGNDNIKVGVMTCEPSVNRSVKNGFFEFCYLIEGLIELTEEGGEPVTYKAGDTFLMQDGFQGIWRTIEKYKKVYVCVYS
ncbi:MAG: DUF861 domain-containing protein [Alteromonadaceae bacterium]|nr:DUF861 domain-containing protein [Alteromonadaceae bacterium]